MVIKTYNPPQDKIDKIQILKGKSKINMSQKKSNNYNEMNYRRQSNTFQVEQDQFAEKFEGIGEIYHDILFLMKVQPTEPQAKSKNII